MSYWNNFVFFCCLSILIFSCEEPYTPSTLESEQEYVVEGYVEAGEDSNPVFVLITKSIPFISKIDPGKFSELFVKGAKVSVNDGDKTIQLTEVCLSQIPEPLKAEVYQILGFNPDSINLDLCIYADIFNQIKRESGRKYDLEIRIGDKLLTSSTTIPQPVSLKNFKWTETPGIPNDTLARLLVTIEDPKDVANYYRYFTAEGDENLIPPFGSVRDDALFNGQTFEFPLQKAERRGGDFTPETFGFFKRGKMARVKWSSMDKEHYDFWNTRDFNANSGGPFASYIRINFNIKGGIGIWGGYASETYNLTVPPR